MLDISAKCPQEDFKIPFNYNKYSIHSKSSPNPPPTLLQKKREKKIRHENEQVRGQDLNGRVHFCTATAMTQCSL